MIAPSSDDHLGAALVDHVLDVIPKADHRCDAVVVLLAVLCTYGPPSVRQRTWGDENNRVGHGKPPGKGERPACPPNRLVVDKMIEGPAHLRAFIIAYAVTLPTHAVHVRVESGHMDYLG